MELDKQESLVWRLRNRTPEPHRTALFQRIAQRLREVFDRLGAQASRDDLMAEMYLIGVHDGSEMLKAMQMHERSKQT